VNHRSVVAAVVVSLLVVASCSGGDDRAAEPVATSEPTSTEPPTLATDPPSTDPPSTDQGTDPPMGTVSDDSTVEPTETTEPPPTSAALLEGFDVSVELMTATSGGGIRPLLEWSPHEGATWYLATLYAPDGTVYWTWTGPSTSVHVGGDPRLDDGVPGPSVIEGMSWGVVALDADVVPIAMSARLPIAP
jgi:hypothetical protein